MISGVEMYTNVVFGMVKSCPLYRGVLNSECPDFRGVRLYSVINSVRSRGSSGAFWLPLFDEISIKAI